MFKIKVIDCDSVPELLKAIKWPKYGLKHSTALAVLRSKVERKDWHFFELIDV